MATGALVVGVTAKFLARTTARRVASKHGEHYLSLPDFYLDLLADPALLTNYEQGARRAWRLAGLFTAGTIDLTGPVGNCCPGRVIGASELGSPSSIKANISPVESASEGIKVIGGSIPYPSLGLPVEPGRLSVTGGRIAEMNGPGEITADRLL